LSPDALALALPLAHAAACAAMRDLGLPSPDAPSSLDVLYELRRAGGDATQTAVRAYAKCAGLKMADVVPR
jgi:hypothetical protein